MATETAMVEIACGNATDIETVDRTQTVAHILFKVTAKTISKYAAAIQQAERTLATAR